MKSCHYLISGRVQGVGFRAFTQKIALQYNIRGWVRNLSDGRVEVLASGTAENLWEFENILRRGPTHARVDKFEVNLVDGNLTVNEFTLLQDEDQSWQKN